MNRKKLLASLLATAMAFSAVGCGSTGNNKADSKSDNAKQSTEQSTSASGSESAAQEETVADAGFYPIAGGGKLTWWVSLNSNVSSNFTSMEDTEFAKALTEQTGVEIDYIHPATGQEGETFNLMVADGEFPDLLEYNFNTYAGGPTKAIEDGVIIPLNDVIDKYCPNLKAFLAENPDIDNAVKTDDGIYYCFPCAMDQADLAVTRGLCLREDWLKELNMEVPESIEEWYEVLTAFKNEMGAESPLCVSWSDLSGSTLANAFGVAAKEWYIDSEGKVVYGAVTDEYKNFLITMKQWYAEGLLDVDMASLKSDNVTSKMINGNGGASFAWAGSGMQSWILAATETNPDYMLVAAPVPSYNGVDPIAGYGGFRFKTAGCVSISSDCENVELAARLLDYGYSEEGRLLYNYGVEGVSYEMIDGVATYTDEVLNNPDGLSITHAIAKYARSCYQGPFVQELNYYTQYLQVPSVKEAPSIWTVDTTLDHMYPSASTTPEESDELSKISDELWTYMSEMILKFVLGTKSFDEWDQYVEDMESLGLNRAIEIKEAALERYNAR